MKDRKYAKILEKIRNQKNTMYSVLYNDIVHCTLYTLNYYTDVHVFHIICILTKSNAATSIADLISWTMSISCLPYYKHITTRNRVNAGSECNWTNFILEDTLGSQHLVKDVFAHVTVNGAQRIVQEVDVGIAVHRPCQGYSLLLAAG